MSNSWYHSTPLSKSELKYLTAIQAIWKIKLPTKKWAPYILTPHQIEWHKTDVAIQQENAKDRVVIKSRNTSFTTSSIISNLMAVPYFPSQVVPFVRLNIKRAMDLIKDIKEHIENMTPIVLPDGTLYPFDPEKVDMKESSSIKFPNGVEFRAFPATNASAENIRGLRITGSAGLIDESNFMKDFENIYISLRDAFSGTFEGKKIFQMNIGTTLKGRSTPFKLWYDKMRKNPDGILFFEWPVFDKTKVTYEKDFKDQNLIPIVEWHDIDELQKKSKQDILKFKEEYMAEVVESEETFYPFELVIQNTNTELEHNDLPPEDCGLIYGGCDPAGEGGDYFVITFFEKLITETGETNIQRYLYYTKNAQLDELKIKCDKLISQWKPIKFRIDGNGLGYQLGQYLSKKFPSIVEVIRGAIKVRGTSEFKISLNEFMHTNLKELLYSNSLQLLNDELQLIHFSMWKSNYQCERHSEYGHGDIIPSLAFALLHDKWRTGLKTVGAVAIREKSSFKSKEEYLEDFAKNPLTRIEFYKKQNKRLFS